MINRSKLLVPQLCCLALLLPPTVLADRLRVDEGAWVGVFDTDGQDEQRGPRCELSTGGYDRASKEQNPRLSITIRGGSDGGPEVEVTASAVTEMRKEDLLRARLALRVEGESSTVVPAFPSAMVDNAGQLTIALRPRLPREQEQAGLRRLIADMRAGERMVVSINGRTLQPSFSLEGFDLVWDKAVSHCALSKDWH